MDTGLGVSNSLSGPPQIAPIPCQSRWMSPPPEQRFYCPLIIRTRCDPPVFTSTVKMFPTPRRVEFVLEGIGPNEVVSYTARICAGIANSFPAQQRERSPLRPSSSHPFIADIIRLSDSRFPTQKQRTSSQIIVRRYSREFSSLSSIGASCFQKPLASIRFQKAVLLQIVNVNQSNSRGVAYTTHNGGVVARLQISNDR